ncbi:SDR family oxidoreductase [Arthrobacter sp. TB 26]|uniref:SDR family oxidoreductase n=1 Tax=Arthrobacter sp. TB 26 TaxID=494420 RepID=UPI0003FA2083|nr:SDR family oxidoreductase [Arthrobacter sp. TB 26]
MARQNKAIVIGSTGVSGAALVHKLEHEGFEVWGVSRGNTGSPTGARTIAVDLAGESDLREITELAPTHVFYTAWKRHPTEAENIAVNGMMVRRALEAAGKGGAVQHVALVTGLKQYIGPPELQGTIPTPDTPFKEDAPRLPIKMFYYAQEDELFRAAETYAFAWSVHRAHTIVGHAVGNAMNIAATLGAQAAICREEGRPFVFPGSRVRWDGLGDMTDADLLADHMHWAATTPGVGNEAYNVVNGDVFRWRTMWPLIAEMLGVQAADFPEERMPLTKQMVDSEDTWRRIAQQDNLVEPDVNRVASWWHTDGDLGRWIEMLADMSKSRRAGYTGYIATDDSFRKTFEQYRESHVLPRIRAQRPHLVPSDRVAPGY